jgi:hypothetical protein
MFADFILAYMCKNEKIGTLGEKIDENKIYFEKSLQ